MSLFGNLFKPGEERRRELAIERKIKVQKAVGEIKRQIQQNRQYQQRFTETAKRALQLGKTAKYEMLKAAILRTMVARDRLEDQLLTLETASIFKDQAEGAANFARAMNAIAQGVLDGYEQVDLQETQVRFEKAIEKAQTLEEQMALFLSASSDAMSAAQPAGEGDAATLEEIDRLIRSESAHEEASGAPSNAQLDKDMEALEALLRKEGK